jgi:CPA1 family monovalent cation:H+ antiporter
VLTLPLALADGSEFPARDLIIFLAAGVIILSLTAASVLLPHLLEGLHLPSESVEDEEIDRARVIAAKAAIRAVEEASHDMASGHSDADVYADAATRVMDTYRRRLEGHLSGENSMRARRANAIERKLRLAAIRAERETLFDLARSKKISDGKSRLLIRELDLIEERLS